MKYIKRFFESNVSDLCIKYIDEYNSTYGDYINRSSITTGNLSYTIKNDIVDIKGTVSLDIDLDEIPFNISEVSSIFLNGNIKTLKNTPRIVKFSFNIGGCKNITSFENGPDRVGAFIHLGDLLIDSFVDIPRPIKQNYQITSSNYSLRELFKIILKPKSEQGYFIVDDEVCDNIEIFNECDPIRSNNEYSLSRLNDYFSLIGKNNITKLEYWKNIDTHE